MRTRIKLTVLSIVSACALVALPSCSVDSAQANAAADALIDATNESIDTLNERIAVSQSRIDGLDADSAARQQAQQVLDAVIATRDRAVQIVADLESSRNDAGSFTTIGVGDVVSSYLPAPFNVLAPLALSVFGLARSRKIRAAAHEIVQSVDAARRMDDSFDAVMNEDRIREVVNATQSKLAKRIVDEAQNKKLKPLA